MIIDRVSDAIQAAIHANTDMATKAFRFLDSLYSEEGSRLEHTTMTNLYAVRMTTTESLQTYLSRAAGMYAQIPKIQGQSTCSVSNFLNLVVKGLNSRPEYDGYINQFNPTATTTFSSLQSAIFNWCLVKQVGPAPSPEEAELAAAAYRVRRPFNSRNLPIRDRSSSYRKMTSWNCGGIVHSSRECISEDTDLAFKPADSDEADHGSQSPPKQRSGDGKDSDDKKTHKKTSDRRQQRPRRYQSRGSHAHVADGDQSTSTSDPTLTVGVRSTTSCPWHWMKTTSNP